MLPREALQAAQQEECESDCHCESSTAAPSAAAEEDLSERGSSICVDWPPVPVQPAGAADASALEPPVAPAAVRSKREQRVASQRPVDLTLCTTVIVQGVPRCYTRDMLLGLFDDHGFLERIDFVFVPIDFSTGDNQAHAYVNFVSPLDAAAFMDAFHGFSRWWRSWSTEACEVVWSCFEQGFERNVERYRNSPVMHASVPDSFRPVILSNGVRQRFPSPTKKLRPPRRSCSHFGSTAAAAPRA